MIAAAVRAGNARIPRIAETRKVQVESGIRIIDIPGARQFRIVVK
jgi:hypothetical protein